MSETTLGKFKEFLTSLKEDLRKSRTVGLPQRLTYLGPPYKLNVGCGKNIKEGWINIDLLESADLAIDVRYGLPFDDDSCELIYSEHFLEHLEYPDESVPFLQACKRVLMPGGCIHIGVPDSRYVVESCLKDPIDPEFLNKVKTHSWGYPEYCQTGFEFINYHFRLNGQHKFAFDYSTLRAQLEHAAFRNVRKRPFDPQLDTPSRVEGTLYVVAGC
jgi:predicted SAM-dependent methyltransferase